MSNQINMHRSKARDLVARSRAHHAWHAARNRKVTKRTNEDGSVSRVISMSPGLSFKAWARLQIKNNGPEAAECEQWLNVHKAGELQRAAQAERQKNKGGQIALIAAATKQARRKSKKGNAPAPEKAKKGAGALLMG